MKCSTASQATGRLGSRALCGRRPTPSNGCGGIRMPSSRSYGPTGRGIVSKTEP